MKNAIIYIKIALNLIIFILTILFLIFIVLPLAKFFLPFVIGWIISMIANPLVKFLENRVNILRKHSSALIIIVVIAAIVGVIYGFISLLVHEIISLAIDMPGIIAKVSIQFTLLSHKLSGIYNILPLEAQNFVNDFTASFAKTGTKFGTSLGSYIPSFSKASNIFISTIITILSAYFFIKDRDNISSEIKKIVPASFVKSYYMIINNIKVAVGGYFKAQFKIMLIIGVLLFISFELINVKYSFLLALVVAFLDFLPFLGTGVVIWPWAITEFILGNYGKAIFLMVLYLVCQIVKQVLQPKMVGDSIGINPFSALIFMFIGYKLMGFFGLIIGIPVGMIIINFFRMGMINRIIRGITIIFHDINEFRKF